MLAQTIFSFPASGFPPLALGFFGLGTGYLIYGPQELFEVPPRDPRVDLGTGVWGIWMPGFLQFLTGTYLFAGLAWFHTFTQPPLYMAALAFTAYGVHWFAMGFNREHGADPRPNGFMSIAFILISVLGAIVFFKAGDAAVGGLFIGLALVYCADLPASLRLGPAGVAERALGLLHIGVGMWLMYLVFGVTLNFAAGFSVPV